MFQARLQDSVTGGAKINLGGEREVYLCEFERGTGAREIYPSLDQMNKVKTKDSKGFSGRKQMISKKKEVFTEIARDFLAEIGNSSSFSGRKHVISKKKRSSSQTSHEIRCQSTKNTNLGLDLHSSSPEPVNFFGAQFSLGGETIFVWGGTSSPLGGHDPGMPPRGAGSGVFNDLFNLPK